MCDIDVFGQSFKSAEHAYQWKKATDANEPHLAVQIKRAIHAGRAKGLSKAIPEEFCKVWENNSLEAMEEIITAKSQQVPEFKDYLMKTGKAYLAEATHDSFWASGLSVENTSKVNPEFFPGNNRLGQLLMNLREHLHDNVETESQCEDEIEPQACYQDDYPEGSPFSQVNNNTPLGETSASVEEEELNDSTPKATEPKDKNQAASLKHGVSTNIKDFLAKQKEKAKRKPSKTPEKKKSNKLQKTKKGF